MSVDVFQAFPDLASRALSGSVIWANDEAFAQRENLINPWAASFDPQDFDHKGKVYDGWETRRRRGDEGTFDSAIVRLGVPGQIMGIIIDTSWFSGNYPPEANVWGIAIDEYLPAEEIAALPESAWFPLVPQVNLVGNSPQQFVVSEENQNRRVTHVRLNIFPDGGVARLRVHGQVCPDPKFLTDICDLAAAENGGQLVECSDMFYSSPAKTLGLGRAANMSDGWENSRRRGEGNDYAVVKLAAEGTIRFIEIDTSYYVFNAPGKVSLTGISGNGEESVILDSISVLPDARQKFLIDAEDKNFTQIRLDVYPDGGLSRFRVWGLLSEAGRQDIENRWNNA